MARHLHWCYDSNTPFDETEQIRLQECVREVTDAIVAAEGDRDAPSRGRLESFAGYVDRLRTGSLEAQATEWDVPGTFLNESDLRRIGQAASCLPGSFATADWSTYFDGVVVVREEVAPVFETWR